MHSHIGTISVTNFKSRNTEETIKRKTMTNFNYNTNRRPDLVSGESFPTQGNVQRNTNT